MIINIRGCNGSGKSTIVRALLGKGRERRIYGICGPVRPEAHRLELPHVKQFVYALGSYITGVGGCDKIGSAELITQLVLRYQPKGHVVFEGLIISDYYGALCAALEPFGKDVAVIFLTTSYEECLNRLHLRQEASGKAKGEKRVRHHFDSNAAVCKRMQKDDIFQVFRVSSDEALEVVLGLLNDH